MNGLFLTARTNSTRLPNKMILELNNGLLTIEYLIRRLKLCKTECNIILCTTTNSEDNFLEDIAIRNNILCFRGSENDKLMRWHDAAVMYDIDYIVTVDGDDLFTENSIIDSAFQQIRQDGVDFIKGDHTGLICGAFTYAFTRRRRRCS